MIAKTFTSNRLVDSNSRPDRRFGGKALAALSIGLAVSLTGCNDEEVRLPTYKVSGKVVRNGTGVANATVVFHANRTELGLVKPRAITTSDGSFEMTTYEASDGAPFGEYEVSVEQWLTDKPDEGPRNRLPTALGNPAKSGLKAIVAATENVLKPFELKSR